MGWRFRKSVTLFPGVKVNFGMKSASLSLGGKGFRTTYSTTGRVTRSFGIPGTGLSYVTTTNSKKNTSQNASVSQRAHIANRSTPSVLSTPSQIINRNPESDKQAIAVDMIEGIYEVADGSIDWRQILIEDSNPTIPNWSYLKARAERVLNGDLDTYFEIISDLNPVDDLLNFGSEFECGTDDPRMLYIHFRVNSDKVLKDIKHLPRAEYNELLQDYVCGCAIRVARDLFALLPFRRIIIDAGNNGVNILSVEFTRAEMEGVDYRNIDASDFVSSFNHRMTFSPRGGFEAIISLGES